VKQGDLHRKSRDVLSFGVLVDVAHACKAHPGFSRRVTDVPADRLQDMTLHLDERAVVVCLATHVRQFPHGWNPVLGVLKLCSDPQCCATDELVVLLVDDTF
jgi:hypothetical protein